MHSFGGFTRFVSRPCRDAGLSRHCEDFVLLYRVMQGCVPDGTNRQFSTLSLNALCKRRLLTSSIRFWKSENTAKFTFAKAKKMRITVFTNIDFEYNLVFVNIIFAIKTVFSDIVHYCCQMKWFFYPFCVASLSGRWTIGCLVTALRGLRPLVPCYARSRPCRDELPFLLYR